jgi:hypothetical protein
MILVAGHKISIRIEKSAYRIRRLSVMEPLSGYLHPSEILPVQLFAQG